MSDYEKGATDCFNGVPHYDYSTEYTQGYAEQYAKEAEGKA